MQACSGTNKVYDSMAQCMTVCGAMPLGTNDDVSADGQNTVGCRIYHAGVANMSAANANTHCPHASASGGTVCGSLCDAYCTFMGMACNASNNPFTATSTCMNACKFYDTTGNFTITAGANVFCKIYHATAALGSTANANTHCPHASPSGNGPCGTKCENFCSQSTKTCNGTLALYPPSNANCMQFCNSLPDGNITDVAGNTKDCRIYHSLVAGISSSLAVTHCPHASHSGADTCGSYCEVYCQLALQHCTGANVLFPNSGACMTACTPLKTTGKPGDVDGDSIQCRIYHLGAASAGGAAADTHCGHAAPTSKDNVCGALAPSTATATGTTGNAYAIIFSSFMLVAVLLF